MPEKTCERCSQERAVRRIILPDIKDPTGLMFRFVGVNCLQELQQWWVEGALRTQGG